MSAPAPETPSVPSRPITVPVPVVFGLILLLVFGISDRWLRSWRNNSESLHRGIAAVKSFPQTWGEWQGVEVPVDELITEVAGCDAYQSLRFTHLRTGQTCYFSLMVGKAGPMAEHTPEVCLPAQGFTALRNSFEYMNLDSLTEGKVPGLLARMSFVQPRATEVRRVWHGWFDGVRWTRPAMARYNFASRPVLFRLQISTEIADSPRDGETTGGTDPIELFLRDNLPAITKLLQDGPAPEAAPLDLPLEKGDTAVEPVP